MPSSTWTIGLARCASRKASIVISASARSSSTSRMVRISLIMHLSSIIDAVARQGEEEGRALLGDTLGPGAAAMSGDNAADSRQADAGAGKRRRLVQTLEYAEQLVDVAHVESSAVVANPENALFPYVVVADFDDRVLRSRRILYRIVQEVLPCELHHGGI